MIEHLKVGRSAYFYRPKRNLPKSAIEQLFRSLRSQADNPSQNKFHFVRRLSGAAKYSAICFSYERLAAFLEKPANAVECVFGYLMIIESGGLVAVLKAGLDLPSSFRTTYLDRIPAHQVDQAIAEHTAQFEQMRMKNMSPSNLALRHKMFEAENLATVIPTAGANRYVPSSYRVRRTDGNFSATPGTGRISMQSDRADHQELVAFATEIIIRLQAAPGSSSEFLRNFARPVDLSAIHGAIKPTFLAIDVPALVDELLTPDAILRLVKDDHGASTALDAAEMGAVLAGLDESFPIHLDQGKYKIIVPAGGAELGAIRIGKSRISIPKFSLHLLENVFIERCAFQPGGDPDRRLLSRYIDQEDLFTLLFTDLALAYVRGSLFRDEGLTGGGDNFMRHLRSEASLTATDSEKGTFSVGQQEFSDRSVFRAVADHVAADCNVLICDDLGDEWADFIGIKTTTKPTIISFYHAKHGPLSLSASAFHDAVGQAQKNLGHMALMASSMPSKLASWDRTYKNNGVRTSISRIMRGGARADIEQTIGEARLAPDLVKHVYIVTSSLSRADVAQTFTAAAQGTAPSAHFVQLYWLLTNYFSNCREMGATGYVVCRP